jgi:hypothetical protein
MEDTKLGKLINELKALKIKESEIKVRESQIIWEIKLINKRKQRQVTTKTTSHQLQTPLSVNGIKQGDRVVIKNKVIKPATPHRRNVDKGKGASSNSHKSDREPGTFYN